MIRLDAIAYLWKEIGTSCIHLPQTHMVIKLFRDIFEYCAPHVKIITETNVPHKENISYFGNGNDEAHLVYNFALPPLTAYTLQSGDATILSKWAESLIPPGKNAYFYNFTASHDGIGVLPAKNILADEQIDILVKETEKRGGRVSYKSNADGSQSAYELNISLFDLISDPEADEPITTKVKRFIASQAIALSIIGIPSIYYHSIVGSRNYHEGVKKTGVNRAINREKLNLSEIAKDLESRGTIRNLVLNGLTTLIKKRRLCRAFHPQGMQRVLKLHRGVFALERSSPEGNELILSLINVTDRAIELSIDHTCKRDVISEKIFQDRFTIDPYETLWLQQYPQS
jgi:sucrose phosphorylase